MATWQANTGGHQRVIRRPNIKGVERGVWGAVAFAGADVVVSVLGEKFVVTYRSRVTACHLAMGLAESTAGR